MNEYLTVWQGFVGLIGVSVACLCYGLGGRANKWIRRFLGSFILALTVNGLCAWRGIWSPLMLTIWPALAVGFSLGYGDKGLGNWFKLMRRSIYAVGILFSGVIMTLIIGGAAWTVFVPHVGVGIWSIYLGCKNPVEAAFEEMWICALLNIGLIAYPFVNG